MVPSTPLTWKAIRNVPALLVSVGVAIAMLTSESDLPFCCRNVWRSLCPIGIPAGQADPPKLVFWNATPLTLDGSIASSSGALPGRRPPPGREPLSVAAGCSEAAAADDAAGATDAGADVDPPFGATVGAGVD